MFCTFLRRSVLRATTACTFSTSQLPTVFRRSGVLCVFTSKCSSRHNGVQFFISHLASWLRARRFSEPTFRPSGAANHWKNTVFRDFPTFFAHLDLLSSETFSFLIFFLLSSFFFLLSSLLLSSLLLSSLLFSSLTLPTSAFHLSILSEVWFLNFPRSLGLSSCMLYPILFAICMTSHCGRPRGKLTENLPLAPLAPLAFVARGWNHLFLPQVEQAEQAGQVAEIT